MRFFLANTLKELRERAGLRLEDVVPHVRKPGYSQLSRFEAHESWPSNFDQVVAGYAVALGVEDGRDLWRIALERWLAYGAAPETTTAAQAVASPSRDFADLLKEQEERDRARHTGARPARSSATPKRRAAGRSGR